MKKKRVVLLDAHSIIHRSYHALPGLTNSKGEPTGALYGLSLMLLSIIKELKPDFIFAAYDLPGKTMRHDMFDKYKSGRKKAEPDLVAQLKKSRELLDALSIKTIDAKGYEADDVLGTLAERLKKDFDVIIASGDLDMLQLVDDKRVRVYTLKRSIKDTILYDEDAVKARFSFGPEYIVDFKALKGDPSDNIPGVRGIGDKTATELILKFGHLENIYKTLKENKEEFLKHFKERIAKLLEESEEEAFFSKTLASIILDAPIKFEMPKKTWKESVDIKKAIKMLYELEFRTLISRFESLFEDGSNANNLKYEEVDTESLRFKRLAIALWLVRSDIIDPSLDDIYNFAGVRVFDEAEKIIFKALKERKQEFVFYNIEEPLIPVVDKLNKTGILLDIKYLNSLSKDYHKKLDTLKKDIFKLAGKEFNINSPLQLSKVLFDDLKIKPASSKKTSTGRPTTQESELEKIKSQHPIIEKILSYRELQKLLSTYIDNLPKMVKDDGRLYTRFIQSGTSTGRMASQNPNLQNIPIRTDLGKAVRGAFVAQKGFLLASFDYSQIELRIAAILSGDEELIKAFKEGKDIHRAVASRVFEVPEDEVDYELRRRAKIINFGILYGMGAKSLRENLGNIDMKEAREFLNKYFEKYKTLAEWIEKTKSSAQRKGYTETLFGRRRYFEGINSDIQYIRAQAERMAINAPIQGTQADIIKMAMVKIDKALDKVNKNAENARLVLQIHDELIYEIKEDLLDELKLEIKQIMENILDQDKSKGVPIVVKISSGKNWADL